MLRRVVYFNFPLCIMTHAEFFSLCLEEEKRFMNWDLVKAKRRPNDCHLKMTYNFSIHAPHIRHGINLCTQDEMQIKTTF